MIAMAQIMAGSMAINQKEWKDRILKQWEESRHMPRKKKKAVRKNLRVEWSIACYDPLGMSGFID